MVLVRAPGRNQTKGAMGRFTLERLTTIGRTPPPPWSPSLGCIGKGEAPTPRQGAQPMPSLCPPDAKCQPQWHL